MWNGEEEPLWTVSVTEAIKARVKALAYPRYKVVVQVILGQSKHQGVKIASRCLWDTDTDNYASATLVNVREPAGGCGGVGW